MRPVIKAPCGKLEAFSAKELFETFDDLTAKRGLRTVRVSAPR